MCYNVTEVLYMSELSKIIGTVEIICPRCGYNISNKHIMGDHTEFGECKKCGKMTYHKLLKSILPQNTTQNINRISCPYCNSTNVKKISTTSKVAYGATFGIFAASKIANQWHCNNCKSDF